MDRRITATLARRISPTQVCVTALNAKDQVVEQIEGAPADLREFLADEDTARTPRMLHALILLERMERRFGRATHAKAQQPAEDLLYDFNYVGSRHHY